MNMCLASPHMHGCELRLYDPEQFRDDYDNQGASDDNFAESGKSFDVVRICQVSQSRPARRYAQKH